MSGKHKMGHLQNMSVYLGVFAALVVLTGLTYLASDRDFGSTLANELVAMGIATVKASLVVLFFMHGKYEGKGTWAFIVYPLVVLFILFAALFMDYISRKEGALPRFELEEPYLADDHLAGHEAGSDATSHKPSDAEHGDTGHEAGTLEHAAPAEHGTDTPAEENKDAGDH